MQQSVQFADRTEARTQFEALLLGALAEDAETERRRAQGRANINAYHYSKGHRVRGNDKVDHKRTVEAKRFSRQMRALHKLALRGIA